jgi:cystathionine gamma-lyase
MGFATKAIHVGNEPDPVTGSIIPAIHQTSTYVQKSPGVHGGYEYTRSHNPTRSRLESCLASLEHAQFCLVTSSGMAAMTLLMQSLGANASVFCGDDVYGGTYRLLTKVFHETLKTTFIDTTDLKKTSDALLAQKPKLLWIETPTNPMLKISDIQALSAAAHSVGCLVAVDNTFMSPYFQNPLLLGADIVIHSMTKFINGHSDVVGGAIMLNDETLYKKLWFLQNATGPSQSPFDSWLVIRGIKTLEVRMQRHEENALYLAQKLSNHPQVEKVIYPGLASHPQHELAKKQMKGFGGMMTVYVKGGLKKATQVLEAVTLFSLAESLGGVESLIEHPAIMTHASVPAAEREKLGIHDQMIRLSVGIENVQDLWNDLNNALNAPS